MYPSEKYPHYGVFVKNTESILIDMGVEVDRIVLNKQDTKVRKIKEYFKFYLKAIRSAKNNTYNAIYGHYASHIAIPIIIIKKMRPKLNIIVNVHGNDIVPEDKKDKKLLKFSRKLLKISDIVIAPSNYFKKILIEEYNVTQNQIKIYPSGGIDSTLFKPIDKEIAKGYLKLDKENKYIGFVSRLENKKGWDTLLKAIKILDPILDNKIKFLFVGDGKEKILFEDMIKKMKIENRIVHESFKKQEDLPYVYNALEMFCFPTYRKSESLGLVGLEAMSCGQIVIASDIGGPKDYIDNNINGFLFPPQNEKELANKIKLVINMIPNDRRKITEKAIETSRKYEKSKTKEKLIEIFAKL